MSEGIVVRRAGEGRTVLVGGGDYVTYKVRSAESDGAYFCFEASTTPGFGPPLHRHEYRELFYVLEGSYEFTVERDGRLETIVAGAGSTVAVEPDIAHTFKNASGAPGRMLFVHQPAALEEFFEEFGVSTDEVRPDAGPPDFAAMAAALERNGVHVVGAPV